MSAEHGGAPARKRTWVYIIAGAGLALLLIWGVVVFEGVKDNAQSRKKADQLINSLNDAGLPAPSKQFIVDTLGTDGGMVCEDPGSDLALARFNSMLSNGASGPGGRPTIGDRQAVAAEGLILATYCPNQLGKFAKHVDGMKFEDTRR